MIIIYLPYEAQRLFLSNFCAERHNLRKGRCSVTELLQSTEAAILLFLQDIRNPVLNAVFITFSVSCNYGLIWIITAVVLMLFRKTRSAGFRLALCLLASLLINNLILKNLIMRPRPYTEVEGLTLLLPRLASAGSFSFPSGHTGASFAAAFSLSASFGKRGKLAYIAACLTALSRLYIGAHYPTDVLFGAIFGLLGAAAAGYMYRRVSAKYHKKC